MCLAFLTLFSEIFLRYIHFFKTSAGCWCTYVFLEYEFIPAGSEIFRCGFHTEGAGLLGRNEIAGNQQRSLWLVTYDLRSILNLSQPCSPIPGITSKSLPGKKFFAEPIHVTT